jgi:phosphopantetheinyl transferase
MSTAGCERDIIVKAVGQTPNAGRGVARTAPEERRSTSRPTFVEGWQRFVGRLPPSNGRAVGRDLVNQIKVWVAGTDTLLRAESCLQLLTKQDWQAFDRIQHQANRSCAVAARVLLRLGLSKAVDRKVDPSEWQFSHGPNDQPHVAPDFPQVEFSVSHIDKLAMVAISSHARVGLDVESVDQDISDNAISGFCHLNEERSIRNSHTSRKAREFIRLWTLKEAYTKMLGRGHSIDFKTISCISALDNFAGVEDDEVRQAATFESFYVSVGHSLCHASISIAQTGQQADRSELQIISLLGTGNTEAATIAPISSGYPA